MHTFVYLVITPTVLVFNIFLKIWEQSSQCQLEVHLANCPTSEMAETPFRAKGMAPLSPASSEKTAEMLCFENTI